MFHHLPGAVELVTIDASPRTLRGAKARTRASNHEEETMLLIEDER
jgi:hypothetical protein